jgi:hypothetical protein
MKNERLTLLELAIAGIEELRRFGWTEADGVDIGTAISCLQHVRTNVVRKLSRAEQQTQQERKQ